MNQYRCRICGKVHDGIPLSYGVKAPELWFTIPEEERHARTFLASDQCEIDKEFFFIVGNIDIPIIDTEGTFSWTVWVSLSKKHYKRAGKLWNKKGRESEPPYFGWLSTRLPLYPNTLNLKTMVHTRQVGLRHYIELEPTDHPLAIEQRQGITQERVQEFAEKILHHE